jgi:Flp pilus assembly protein TadG
VKQRGRGDQRDQGQAAVEFALALPLVVVLVLGIVQVVVVVRDQLAVEFAAREGARAAAVSAAPATAAQAAARAATAIHPLRVDTVATVSRVRVTVSHTSRTRVPLIGALVSDIELTASVTMAREPP